MQSMQPTNNMQSVLIRLLRIDRFWQFCFRQQTASADRFRNTRLRIKPLVLQEENDSLGPSVVCGQRQLTMIYHSRM